MSGTASETMPRRLSLAQQCEQLLRARILQGTYPPGQRFVETRLSQELGVSRGPLREALQVLQQEGLVESDGRGHLSVRQLSVTEILHLFEVRSALETVAIQHAAARPDHAEIADELDELLAPLRSVGTSFAEQIASDLRFHERLCELSGNPTLLSIWRQLAGQIRIMILAAGPAEAADRMRSDEHAPLAQAVRTGDVLASSRAMQEHMALFCARYAGSAAAHSVQFDAGPALSLDLSSR